MSDEHEKSSESTEGLSEQQQAPLTPSLVQMEPLLDELRALAASRGQSPALDKLLPCAVALAQLRVHERLCAALERLVELEECRQRAEASPYEALSQEAQRALSLAFGNVFQDEVGLKLPGEDDR